MHQWLRLVMANRDHKPPCRCFETAHQLSSPNIEPNDPHQPACMIGEDHFFVPF